jgi:hypothetical protein
VLERAAVPVAHQVVDQALGTLRVLLQLVEGLLPERGDTGGEQYVGVRSAVFHQLHSDIAAELDLEVVLGDHGVGGPSRLVVWRTPLYPVRRLVPDGKKSVKRGTFAGVRSSLRMTKIRSVPEGRPTPDVRSA